MHYLKVVLKAYCYLDGISKKMKKYFDPNEESNLPVSVTDQIHVLFNVL